MKERYGRRGQCPSLSSPMETGDGLLLRLPPLLTPLIAEQWQCLSRLASEEGNGLIEVTQRGNIQLRGFDNDSAERFTQSVMSFVDLPLSSVAISCEPFFSYSPCSVERISLQRYLPASDHPDGHRQQETNQKSTSDTSYALIRWLDSAINGAGFVLAPKCSIVIESMGLWGYAGLPADIRLRQERGDLLLGIGGNAEEARWFQAINEECSLHQAAMCVLSFMSDKGASTRGYDVKSDPDLEAELLEWGFISDTFKVGGNILPVERLHFYSRIALATRKSSLGLVDEERALIALPFGSFDSHALEALAACCSEHDAILMPLPQRRLLITGVGARSVLNYAAEEGYIVDVADTRLRVFACQGAPRCASGCLNTHDVAEKVVSLLNTHPVDDQTTVHVSGCAKGCARPSASTFTLVGQENRPLGVVMNGKASDPLAYSIPMTLAALKQILYRC